MRRSTVSLFVLWISSVARGQIPEKFENLQFFPKDIERGALIAVMRDFAGSLGVRCEFCHVGDGGPELANMEFASDDKETKRTARRMLVMVSAIQGEHIEKLGREHPVQVGCFTCHRGVARPEPIEAILEEILESSGIEAAVERYRSLRKEHYGSAAYDFSERPLNWLGERRLGAKNPDEAAAILELNAEFHAESAWLHYLLGSAYLSKGDREKALLSFERSLAIQPDSVLARKKIEELRR